MVTNTRNTMTSGPPVFMGCHWPGGKAMPPGKAVSLQLGSEVQMIQGRMGEDGQH